MKMKNESHRNASVQLNQYQQVQRDLNKLKFHLRMKKKVYQEEEYRNISQRLKECQFYFKKMKRGLVQNEANKILAKDKTKHPRRNPKQLQIDIEKTTNNRTVIKNLRTRQENYRIKLKSQQTQFSKSQFMVEYDLQPLNRLQPSSKENTKQQRKNNSRFVSEFQKNIKQSLEKIQLQKFKDVEDFDHIIERSRKNDNQPEKFRKDRSLRLHVPLSTPPTHKSKYETPANKCEGRSIDIAQSQRLQSLRSRINRCRTELSERQREQIDRVSQRRMDIIEKSKILSNFYQKYSNNQKKGDPEALQLMSIATLARADLLLRQI